MQRSDLKWRDTLKMLDYSQSSLQSFVDCPRRFQLRYLLQQAWPAPPAEPLSDVEQADRLGRQFHLIMQRHWLGLPIHRDTLDPTLRPWWDAFTQHPPKGLPGTIRRPEVHTSARVHDQRMVAMFDLLAYEPGGSAVIVDWKTAQRRPTRVWLDRRMQTVIYPLLLVESSARLLGYPLRPEDVRLVYWFANAPTDVEVFQYSTARYESDKQTLAALLDRLFALDVNSVWPLTPIKAFCRLCQYRSLCERGSVAGRLDEEYDDAPESAAEAIIIPPDEFVL